MAYDEGQAQILRDSLAGVPGITEKKMFGGLCFLMNGNMLCGVHKDGGMFRVGKDREAEALAIEGARELGFTGRRMGGMIEVDGAFFEDESKVAKLRDLALGFVGPMPPK